MKLINWLIGLTIASLLSILFLEYAFSISPISIYWLIIFLALWSGFGALSKDKTHTGLLSNWIAPFKKLDVKFLTIAALTATVSGTFLINETIAWDLSWAIVPTIPIILIAVTFFKAFHGIPWLRFIILFGVFQTYMIFAVIVYIFNLDYQTKVLFEPKSSINIILSCIVYLMLILLTYLNTSLLKYFDFYQEMISNQESVQNLSHKTRKQIAVHEAGHAMMYSYFKTLPKQINIFLYEKALNKDGKSRGLVVAMVPISDSKSFREWEMLLALSGTRAELIAYGAHSDGSEADIKNWQHLAHTFLSQFDIRYTNQPTTPAHFATNKRLETELFQKHIQIIDKFLKKNKQIMLALAKQAMVFHSLDHSHIEKHLSKVRYTSNFPRENRFF